MHGSLLVQGVDFIEMSISLADWSVVYDTKYFVTTLF